MATKEQIVRLKNRIKQADSVGALRVLDDKIDIFYNVGDLTEKQLGDLAVLIMERFAELH